MKNADVQKLITRAAARGRKVDEYDAAVVLLAHEFMASPTGRTQQHLDAAREVVAEFDTFMATGVESNSLAMFDLPLPLTDEEKDAEERSRNEYLKATQGVSQ